MKIEGKNSVRELLRTKKTIDKILIANGFFSSIAYVSDYKYAELGEILAAVENKEDAFLVMLDGVEDPHNLGSVIRVCECAGVDGLIIGKRRSASVTDAVMRISEGSANHLKIARVTNLNSALDEIKKANIWAYALELGGNNIYKNKLTGRICMVIGGEDSGVNELTRKKCDAHISIPMYGNVNSLNASVACGIGVFEALRQRKDV